MYSDIEIINIYYLIENNKKIDEYSKLKNIYNILKYIINRWKWINKKVS